MSPARARGRPALRRGAFLLVVAAGEWFASRDARAEDTVTYEVREQVVGALLPTHDYAVTGACATGQGTAAASVYAQGTSGRGEGAGVGIGGRVAYQSARPPPRAGDPTWWSFRMSLGLDADILFARVDTRLTDVSGELCARVKADGAELQHRGSSVLFLQVPAFVGAEMALGGARQDQTGSSRAILLGAGWAPAVTFFKPWVGHSDFGASFFGTELTLDFATWRRDPTRQERKRAAIFLLLPPDDRGPVVLTLSFGAVWN